MSLSYIDIRFSSFVNEGHSVDTLFCDPHLTSHVAQKGNFTLKIYILILVIKSLISSHQNDLNVVTIKSTGHKPKSDYQIESYHQIKFSSNQVLIAEMHHHKLSLTICDYEQLMSIGYNYNQFEIDNVS